ncbi:hypothetical protein AB0M35_08180 [Micromonospora sp. NPDC051196]|uniref:hypothetical protein n=1 Tax=Micromonospora sp. NPDC051196 TaxID=3155281 RepID=UPI00341353AC
MGEVESGADDVADLSWAGCAVTQGSPAADEDREAAFSEASHGSKDGVVGAVVDREPPTTSRRPADT